jgi:hypothetical protein
MRLRSLSTLKRPEPREVPLAALPRAITMAAQALEKAFRINEMVLAVHGESLEWYGFTLGLVEQPDFVADIGLPQNDLNLTVYAGLSAETIARFQESLPKGTLINGWIHSHGALTVKDFSRTDARNHEVVLDFVGASLKRPVAKREVPVRDLALLVRDRYAPQDLAKGTVAIITDAPITEAVILETVYGSWCFAVVVGDDGWHRQEIHYREYGILSGQARVGHGDAELVLVGAGGEWSHSDSRSLREEVERKVRPNKNPPLETLERM